MRDDFGCEAEKCTCPKHLRISALDHPDFSDLFAEIRGDYGPRISFVLRHESMVTMGCRFQLNDLSPLAWRDLIVLAEERAWMRSRVEDLRYTLREKRTKEDAALAKSRQDAGIPPPGQSIFPAKPKK